MKKFVLSFSFISLFAIASQAQIMVSKLVGKDASKYGLGYGVFTYLDFPLANQHSSVRLELLDLAIYPTKGDNLFTSTKDMLGYISIKLGYKYVFSETQAGFYLLPSAGYCRVIFVGEGKNATYGDGIAGALEGGYAAGSRAKRTNC